MIERKYFVIVENDTEEPLIVLVTRKSLFPNKKAVSKEALKIATESNLGFTKAKVNGVTKL